MPQMSPIMWSAMLITMSIIMMIMYLISFFEKHMKAKIHFNETKMKSKSWTW